MWKKILIIILITLILAFLIIGIIVLNKLNKENDYAQVNNINMKNESNQSDNISNKIGDFKVNNIKIRVNDNILTMKLEQNKATEELLKKLNEGEVIINAHEYGDFEKVGNLGFSLPTSDSQIKTKPGDVMLYQGNQITLFYGTNSWSYTKLGEIIDKNQDELKEILGSGDVNLILSIN